MLAGDNVPQPTAPLPRRTAHDQNPHSHLLDRCTISTLTGSAFAQETEPVATDATRGSLVRATRAMRDIDVNGNGTFEKDENAAAWRRYRKLDANKDGVLSIEELRKDRIAYLEPGGERKLDIVYKTVLQRKLLLDLYYPTNKSEEADSSRPVIIYTHGGGWAAGSKQGIANGSFKVVFQKLLDHGFAVASVNCRLCKPDSGVTMRDCVIDSKDAMRYLARNSDALEAGSRPDFLSWVTLPAGRSRNAPAVVAGIFAWRQTAGIDVLQILAGVSWYGPCDFEKTDLFNHDDRANSGIDLVRRILGVDSQAAD